MRNKILKSAYSIMSSVTWLSYNALLSCLLSIYGESSCFIGCDDDQDFLVLCKCSKTENKFSLAARPHGATADSKAFRVSQIWIDGLECLDSGKLLSPFRVSVCPFVKLN